MLRACTELAEVLSKHKRGDLSGIQVSSSLMKVLTIKFTLYALIKVTPLHNMMKNLDRNWKMLNKCRTILIWMKPFSKIN